jgi:DNA-binding CsgD family transcriptional regulator
VEVGNVEAAIRGANPEAFWHPSCSIRRENRRNAAMSTPPVSEILSKIVTGILQGERAPGVVQHGDYLIAVQTPGAPHLMRIDVYQVGNPDDAASAHRLIARLLRRFYAQEAVSTQLTRREREVLQRLGEGLSNKEIADALQIEVGTVKLHVHHLLEKLGCRHRGELICYARAVLG